MEGSLQNRDLIFVFSLRRHPPTRIDEKFSPLQSGASSIRSDIHLMLRRCERHVTSDGVHLATVSCKQGGA